MKLLLDRASAADALSTSERRIDELRRAGQLFAVQDGREFKYRVEDLQAYVDGLKTFEPKKAS